MGEMQHSTIRVSYAPEYVEAARVVNDPLKYDANISAIVRKGFAALTMQAVRKYVALSK